jgi:hypothetical protein
MSNLIFTTLNINNIILNTNLYIIYLKCIKLLPLFFFFQKSLSCNNFSSKIFNSSISVMDIYKYSHQLYNYINNFSEYCVVSLCLYQSTSGVIDLKSKKKKLLFICTFLFLSGFVVHFEIFTITCLILITI